MHDKLSTLELSIEAKKFGFVWDTEHAFVDTGWNGEPDINSHHYQHAQNHNLKEHRVSRPTLTILQKWFRETHKIIVQPFISPITGKYFVELWTRTDIVKASDKIWERHALIGKGGFDYETALENGLTEAFKLLTLNK